MLRIHKYFEIAIAKKSSDLHLKAGSPPTVRVGGRLLPLPEEPFAYQEMPNLFLPLMGVREQELLRTCMEANFMINYQNRWRIRVCIFRQRGCLSGAFRFIPTKVPSIDSLKLPQKLKEMALRPRGLFLVTGPANSGKSHTLAAMVHEINKGCARHIITIEDPIEFVHKPRKALFTQREIGTMTQDYQSALIYALREDPDVILVGEMRDISTIEMVLTAAETGHLVIGTLATSSAAKSVDRIIDAFPPGEQNQVRAMVSESLKAVVSQRLIPNKAGTGLELALEILIGTLSVANLIRDAKTFQLQSLMQTGRNIGMQLMDDSLLKLVKEDKIAVEQALAVASNKKLFQAQVS